MISQERTLYVIIAQNTLQTAPLLSKKAKRLFDSLSGGFPRRCQRPTDRPRPAPAFPPGA